MPLPLAEILRLTDLAALKGVLLTISVPALILLSYRLGGESWLLLSAIFLPLPLLLRGACRVSAPRPAGETDGLTGCMTERHFLECVGNTLQQVPSSGRTTACLVIELETLPRIRARYGDGAAEDALRFTARRISAALRSDDLIARIGDARFAICLAPVIRLELDSCLQIAARLQAATEEPVPLQAASLHMNSSIGICLLSRLTKPGPRSLVAAATLALDEAVRTGGSAVRSYSSDMKRRAVRRDRSETEARLALERGQITAWFQPQISTDTGRVTGFETLARWDHPERGILPPSEFLVPMEQAGQLGVLSDRMLRLALQALHGWDAAGIDVPAVGVNFSDEELADPFLPDRVARLLDRHGIAPARLCIEVLETVIAGSPNDVIVRNVNGLAHLGCRIDLDDFGTGHASISSIRNFAVTRLKMDRSFVAHADTDPEQQKIVAAIVTMAERLDLEILAEGVETAGEHAMLAQLGCTHVQGFGIARPMPFSDTVKWMSRHRARLCPPPGLGRRTG